MGQSLFEGGLSESVLRDKFVSYAENWATTRSRHTEAALAGSCALGYASPSFDEFLFIAVDVKTD